jgi:DNA-binding CsgD family transcriptional regulator
MATTRADLSGLAPNDPLYKLINEAVRTENNRQLEKAKATLTPKERDVWMLYDAGMDVPATAEKLGIGERAVQKHLAKGFDKLSASLGFDVRDVVKWKPAARKRRKGRLSRVSGVARLIAQNAGPGATPQSPGRRNTWMNERDPEIADALQQGLRITRKP